MRGFKGTTGVILVLILALNLCIGCKDSSGPAEEPVAEAEPTIGEGGQAVDDGGQVAPCFIVDTLVDILDARQGTCQGLTAPDLPGPDGRVSITEALCAARYDTNVHSVTFAKDLSGEIRLNWNLPVLDHKRLDLSGPGGDKIRLVPHVPEVPYALGVNCPKGGSVNVKGLSFSGFVSSPVMVVPASSGDAVFEDCSFEGNGVGMTLKGGNVTVRDCRIVGNSRFGIFIEADHNSVENTEISSNGSEGESGGAGIYLRGRGNVIKGCRIERTVGKEGFDHGIYLEQGTENRIAGNTFESNYGHAVILTRSLNNRIEDNTISANSPKSDRAADGINLKDGSSGNTVSGNRILEALGCGIHLTSASKNAVLNNEISNTGLDAVLVDDSPGSVGSTENQVEGNTISGAKGNGIHMQSGDGVLDGNRISGNEISGCKSGVFIEQRTEALTLAGNRIRQCGTGISVLPGTSGITISGNRVRECDGDGLLLKSDGEIVVIGNEFVGNKGWGMRLGCRRSPEGLDTNTLQDNSLGSIENLSQTD